MEAKPILKSKTIWSALVLILIGVLEQLSGVLPDFVSREYLGLALSLIGAVVLVLRFLTGQPLKGKVPPASLLLVLLLSVGGCGVNLTKLIADARMVATVGADVAGGVSAVVGVTCSLVAKYGSNEDRKNCEIATAAAAAAAAASKAAAAAGQPAPAVAAKAQVVEVAQPVDVVVSPAQVEKVRAATLKACPVAIPGKP